MKAKKIGSPLTLSLLMIFATQGSFAADINCSDGGCTFDASLDIRNDSNTPEFSQFEVKDLNVPLKIEAPTGTSPRSTKVFIEAVDPDGENLTIALPSQRKLTSGGSAVVIGQSIKDLLVNLNGRDGDGTPSASSVCATKILNDEYGPQVKSRFLLARFNDPSLPTDRCVPSDLVNVQNNEFACTTGQTEFGGTALSSNRWTQRRSCEALSDRKMCIKRKMKVSCTWVAERFTPGTEGCDENIPNGNATFNPKPRGGGRGSGRDWVCDQSLKSPTASGWKLQFPAVVVDESFVQSRRLAGKTDENICDELTGRFTTYLNGFDTNDTQYYNNGEGLGYSEENSVFFDTDGRPAVKVQHGIHWRYTSSGTWRDNSYYFSSPTDIHISYEGTRACNGSYNTLYYADNFWTLRDFMNARPCDISYQGWNQPYTWRNTSYQGMVGAALSAHLKNGSQICPPSASGIKCATFGSKWIFAGDWSSVWGNTHFKVLNTREPSGEDFQAVPSALAFTPSGSNMIVAGARATSTRSSGCNPGGSGTCTTTYVDLPEKMSRNIIDNFQGECYGFNYEIKQLVYAPNGRIMRRYITVGRMNG